MTEGRLKGVIGVIVDVEQGPEVFWLYKGWSLLMLGKPREEEESGGVGWP